MKQDTNIVDSLLTQAAEYGRISYELGKLHVVDFTANTASGLITRLMVRLLTSCFILFLSLGIAYWIGNRLGELSYGFLIVGAGYGLLAFVLRFFMYKWIKRMLNDYLIRQILN